MTFISMRSNFEMRKVGGKTVIIIFCWDFLSNCIAYFELQGDNRFSLGFSPSRNFHFFFSSIPQQLGYCCVYNLTSAHILATMNFCIAIWWRKNVKSFGFPNDHEFFFKLYKDWSKNILVNSNVVQCIGTFPKNSLKVFACETMYISTLAINFSMGRIFFSILENI